MINHTRVSGSRRRKLWSLIFFTGDKTNSDAQDQKCSFVCWSRWSVADEPDEKASLIRMSKQTFRCPAMCPTIIHPSFYLHLHICLQTKEYKEAQSHFIDKNTFQWKRGDVFLSSISIHNIQNEILQMSLIKAHWRERTGRGEFRNIISHDQSQ